MVPLNLSASTSVASRSGDASSGFTVPFQYNAGIVLGGSGGATQTNEPRQDTSAGLGSSGNETLVYIALGIAVLALVFVAVK